MTSDEKRVKTACKRFDELELGAANGASWTTEEQTFVRRHEAECEVCGALSAGLDAIRYDSAVGVMAGADEVTVRRVVNGAVAAAGPDVQHGPGEGKVAATGSTTLRASAHPARSMKRLAGLSAALAALAAVLVLAFMVIFSGGNKALVLTSPLTSSAGAASGGSVVPVLVAGVVRTQRGAVSVGVPLRGSAELRVAAGRAAIRMGASVTVLLSSNTTVRLGGKGLGAPSLELVAGDIAVAVKPRPGGPRFIVSVADARVTVTGTIFSVRNDGRGAEVAVLRGAVQVTAARRSPQVVTRSRRYVIGTRSAELLEPVRERALWRRAKVLDLLRADRPARLSLRTDPAGATVRVDGVLLGVTPLDASMVEGQRDLQLQLPNHTPVRERIWLRSTAFYDRDFQLTQLRPRPTASRDPGGAGRANDANQDDGWRTLVRLARSKRTARDWRGAAAAYRELIRRYPRRGAARTALVSLGFIQLEHLRRPKAALANFRRYLTGGRRGALAREAAWGQILALGALGRAAAEKKALRRFLARYRRSVYRQRAEARLRKLTPGSMGRRTN